MKKRIFLWIIIFCVSKITAQNIILSGQSNMNGWPMGGFPYDTSSVEPRIGVTSFGSNTHTALWANGPYDPADTLEYPANIYGPGGSFAMGSGGVGLIGMALANLIDTPSVIINGCAAAADIDFFQRNPLLPALSTQYGATLCRVRASHKSFRHFVWWQGEADAYRYNQYQGKLKQMIIALKQDIPELEHFYIVQLNPVLWCSGSGQDSLRERQRQMDGWNINGVSIHVVAALGTYQFDGCHLEPEGYIEIGRRLSLMIKHYEDSVNPLFIPNVDGIYWVPGIGVKMVFQNPVHQWYFGYPGTPVSGVIPPGEELKNYFFFKGGSPNSVSNIEYNYDGNPSVVMLHVTNTSPAVRPLKLTYLPDYRYSSRNQAYQGPWMFGTFDHFAVPSFAQISILDLPLVLPITIVSFDAKVVDDEKIELSLHMEDEDSVEYYRIMRSYDGIEFDSIGVRVSNSESYYEFTDMPTVNGYIYYRVDIIASEGIIKTEVRVIRLESERLGSILMINEGNGSISITSRDESYIHVSVYNTSGQLVWHGEGTEVPYRKERIEILFVVVQTNNERKVYKF